MKHLRNFQITEQITKELLFAYNKMTDEQSKYFIRYITKSKKETIADYQNTLSCLKVAKIFEIPQSFVPLLTDTDNVIEPTRLPFPVMWIECEVPIDDLFAYHDNITDRDIRVKKSKYYGFLLFEGSPVSKDLSIGELSHLVKNGKEIIEKQYPEIYIYGVSKDEEGVAHIILALYEEYAHADTTFAESWRAERDYIRKFVMNILDFLNEPDVEKVNVIRSDRSIRKAFKHGKKPKIAKVVTTIRVTGKLKKYIDASCRHMEMRKSYSHTFWVRGHWRKLVRAENSRWLTTRKVWVPFYLKGFGRIINKNYVLDNGNVEKEKFK